MIKHGGRLIEASKKYNIPLENWIDLSTGINPYSWPIKSIPDSCFSRLPEDDDGLHEAAEEYYKAANLLPIAGSQVAIELIPKLRTKCKVAVPKIGYAEHAWQWEKNGHELIYYAADEINEIVRNVDVLILIQPNNPTGEYYSKQDLCKWHKVLQENNGWLIIDEAFIDAETNLESMVVYSHLEGIIVLRSLGKFFGLAGIRIGFVFANKELLKRLSLLLGQWSISGVSRYIAKEALLDHKWHVRNILKLKKASTDMSKLIESELGIKPVGTILFKTVFHENAIELYEEFAAIGILVRLLDNKKGIRLGLANESQWLRISQQVKDICVNTKIINNNKKRIA